MTYAEKIRKMLVDDEGGFATKWFRAIGLTEPAHKAEMTALVNYLTADGKDGSVRGASVMALASLLSALSPALATLRAGQTLNARNVMDEIGEPGDGRSLLDIDGALLAGARPSA